MSSNPFSILLQMFYEPGQAFAAVRQKSHAWLPLLLVIALTVVLMWWYWSTLDPIWMAAKMAADHPEMSTAQRDAFGKMAGAGGGVMAAFATGSAVLGTLLFCAVFAVYLLLAGRFVGLETGFGKWFAFAAWTRVPGLLVLLLMALQIQTGHGQVGMEDLNMASLNFMLLHLAPADRWFGFANAVDFSLVWSTVLTVVGLRVWTERGLATCLTIALLPIVLIFGLWAVKIVAFT